MADGKNTETGTDRRLANLRPPWKPGESGNARGRQRGPSPKAAFLRLLKRQYPVGKNGEKRKGEDLCAEKLLAAVLKGEPWAIKMAFEHVDGKPVQPVDLNLDPELVNRVCESVTQLASSMVAIAGPEGLAAGGEGDSGGEGSISG